MDNNYNNYISILAEKGIDKKDLAKIDSDSLRSLVNQINAYNFTDEQIQQYIKGLLSGLDENFSAKVSHMGLVRNDGIIETNYGAIPNRYANKTINNLESIAYPYSDLDTLLPMAYSGDYRSVVDSTDRTGTYWLVKSETGYREVTAFATLPTISYIDSNDRPYMFFAANTNPSSIVGDYGVVYYPSINSWVPFASTGVWNNSTKKYDMSWVQGNAIPSSVTRIYLHLQATTTSTNDTIRLRVLNANDFSQVFWDKTITFNNNPIDSTYSNLNLYREITMAQINNGTLNTNTGSWFKNAKFSNSYIYNPKGYWQWGTTQTNDAFIKAPTQNKLSTITVNSYSKWYEEDITMRYNIP